MAPLKVFWQPNGTTFDSIGSKRYVRHSDGDTRVRPQDRLFIWPQDVREAVASLNLTPA